MLLLSIKSLPPFSSSFPFGVRQSFSQRIFLLRALLRNLTAFGITMGLIVLAVKGFHYFFDLFISNNSLVNINDYYQILETRQYVPIRLRQIPLPRLSHEHVFGYKYNAKNNKMKICFLFNKTLSHDNTKEKHVQLFTTNLYFPSGSVCMQ